MTAAYSDINELSYVRINTVEHPLFSRVIALLENSFISDERPTFDRALLARSDYSLSAWHYGQKFVGCLSWWNFDGFTFMEHIAIPPELRNDGLGATIIRSFLNRCQDKIVVAECERAINPMAARRIEFFKRLEFIINHYDYIQPAYSSSKSPVPMHLITYPRAITAEEYEYYSGIIRTQVYDFHVANSAKAEG